jgi:fluoroacetyl-CoA thioesterase
MVNPFQPGDQVSFTTTVTEDKLARFPEATDHYAGGLIHPVYSTFALARDAEWCGHLFILQMREPHEQGVGSALTVEHLAPALPGSEVVHTTTLVSVEGRRVRSTFEVHCGARLIARGTQEQVIVDRAELARRLQLLATD